MRQQLAGLKNKAQEHDIYVNIADRNMHNRFTIHIMTPQLNYLVAHPQHPLTTQQSTLRYRLAFKSHRTPRDAKTHPENPLIISCAITSVKGLC